MDKAKNNENKDPLYDMMLEIHGNENVEKKCMENKTDSAKTHELDEEITGINLESYTNKNDEHVIFVDTNCIKNDTYIFDNVVEEIVEFDPLNEVIITEGSEYCNIEVVHEEIIEINSMDELDESTTLIKSEKPEKNAETDTLLSDVKEKIEINSVNEAEALLDVQEEIVESNLTNEPSEEIMEINLVNQDKTIAVLSKHIEENDITEIIENPSVNKEEKRPEENDKVEEKTVKINSKNELLQSTGEMDELNSVVELSEEIEISSVNQLIKPVEEIVQVNSVNQLVEPSENIVEMNSLNKIVENTEEMVEPPGDIVEINSVNELVKPVEEIVEMNETVTAEKNVELNLMNELVETTEEINDTHSINEEDKSTTVIREKMDLQEEIIEINSANKIDENDDTDPLLMDVEEIEINSVNDVDEEKVVEINSVEKSSALIEKPFKENVENQEELIENISVSQIVEPIEVTNMVLDLDAQEKTIEINSKNDAAVPSEILKKLPEEPVNTKIFHMDVDLDIQEEIVANNSLTEEDDDSLFIDEQLENLDKQTFPNEVEEIVEINSTNDVFKPNKVIQEEVDDGLLLDKKIQEDICEMNPVNEIDNTVASVEIVPKENENIEILPNLLKGKTSQIQEDIDDGMIMDKEVQEEISEINSVNEIDNEVVSVETVPKENENIEILPNLLKEKTSQINLINKIETEKKLITESKESENMDIAKKDHNEINSKDICDTLVCNKRKRNNSTSLLEESGEIQNIKELHNDTTEINDKEEQVIDNNSNKDTDKPETHYEPTNKKKKTDVIKDSVSNKNKSNFVINPIAVKQTLREELHTVADKNIVEIQNTDLHKQIDTNFDNEIIINSNSEEDISKSLLNDITEEIIEINDEDDAEKPVIFITSGSLDNNDVIHRTFTSFIITKNKSTENNSEILYNGAIKEVNSKNKTYRHVIVIKTELKEKENTEISDNRVAEESEIESESEMIDNVEELNYNEETVKLNSQKEGKKTETCHLCNKKFYDLKKHMTTHLNKFPHICKICKKGYKKRHNFNQHMLEFHKKKLNEKDINNEVQTIPNLQTTVPTITISASDKKEECYICKKSFYKLYLHYTSHAKEYPFKCEICCKRYKLNPDLNQHIKTHSNVEIVSCHICKEQFEAKNLLEEHCHSMHNEKPVYKYKCKHCPQGFSFQYYLNNHIRIHKNYYSGLKISKKLQGLIEKHIAKTKCMLCNREFESRRLLERHLITHTKDIIFPCTLCPVGYRDSRSLVLHYAKKHDMLNVNIKQAYREKDAEENSLAIENSDSESNSEESTDTDPEESTDEKSTDEKSTDEESTDEESLDDEIVYSQYNGLKLSKKLKGLLIDHKSTLTCKLCNLVTANKACLQKHLIVHTTDTPFKCSKCSEAFRYQRFLTTHYMTKHPEDMKKIDSNKFQEVYKNPKGETEEHEVIKNSMYRGLKLSKTFEELLILHKSLTQCKVCNFKVRNKTQIELHLITHTNDYPFHCKLCPSTYRKKNLLRWHLKNYHISKRKQDKNTTSGSSSSESSSDELSEQETDVNYSSNKKKTASNASEKYSILKLLEEHKSIKNCLICHREFINKKQLQRHLTLHTKSFAFHCKLCKRKFRRIDQLNNHQRNIHSTKERKNENNQNLQTKKSNLDDNAFFCSYCNKIFKQRCLLERHTFSKSCKRRREIVEKRKDIPRKMKCNACQCVFPNMRKYMIHRNSLACKRKRSELMYVTCVHCDESYTRASYFKHITTVKCKRNKSKYAIRNRGVVKVCKYCCESFTSIIDYELHCATIKCKNNRSRFIQLEKEPKPNNFHCDVCQFECESQYKLIKHLNSKKCIENRRNLEKNIVVID